MKKRILSAMLSVIMIAAIFPAVPAAAALKKGDLDNDGKITAADARRVLRASVKLEKLTPEETAAADTDGDNEITAGDARKILRASVGLESLHVHKYEKHEVIKKATCKEKGTEKLICECGAYITKEIPVDPDNHAGGTYVKNKTEATCTKEGYTGDTCCKGCNVKLSSGNVIPATGHKMGTWVNNNNGTHKRKCENKNCNYTETKDCAFSDWTVSKAPTCTEQGSRYKTCTVCGYKVTEALNASGHTWDEGKITKEPTCKDTGIKTFKCTVCGSTKTETLEKDPSKHVGGTEIADIPATCIEQGHIGAEICKGCGAVLKPGERTPIDKNAHSTHEFSKKATCTTDGYKGTECKYCHQVWNKVITEKATGHKWGPVETVKATCTTDGYTFHTCTVCKAIETLSTEKASGHKLEEIESEPSKCNEKGYKISKCSVCGEIIKEELPFGTHTPELRITQEPDCTHREIIQLFCSVCDKPLDAPITGEFKHKFKIDKYEPATCTAPEKKTKVCKCGATEIVETSDPLGHEAHIEESIPATCTENGKIVYSGYCSRCQTVLENATVILKATGHSPDREYATCTEAVKCNDCGETIEPALGHNTLIKDSALGRNVNGFICHRCGSVSESKTENIQTFNNIVDLLKDEDSVYNKTHQVKTFAKSKMNTRYTKFDFGIYTAAIKKIYDDEMANTPDEFAYGGIKEIKNSLPISKDKVSTLSADDIDSIKIDRINGIKMNEILGKFPDEFTANRNIYNISDEKSKEIKEDVIKVTVNIKDEKLSEAVKLPISGDTSLEKIYNDNIRNSIYEYDEKNEKGEYIKVTSESGTGYNISMTMALKEIYSDAVVTYYFTADSYEPIAAIYDIYKKYDQSVDMFFNIGLFSLHGVIDPEIKTEYTQVYIFKNR